MSSTVFDYPILKKQFELASEELELRFPNEKFSILVVGGAALMLLDNQTNKKTNDIDLLWVSDGKIIKVLENYSMNTRVNAFSDQYSSDIQDRWIKLDGINDNLTVLISSLEDVIAAKLAAARKKDYDDLHKKEVIEKINWKTLDHIIFEELVIDYFNERKYEFLKDQYEDYKKWAKING